MTETTKKLTAQSIDRLVAHETRGLREAMLEAEAAHAAAMVRLSQHHRDRLDRDGRMMAYMIGWSFLAGVAVTLLWGAM